MEHGIYEEKIIALESLLERERLKRKRAERLLAEANDTLAVLGMKVGDVVRSRQQGNALLKLLVSELST